MCAYKSLEDYILGKKKCWKEKGGDEFVERG